MKKQCEKNGQKRFLQYLKFSGSLKTLNTHLNAFFVCLSLSLLMCFVVIAPNIALAETKTTEAEVYQYRVTMQQAGKLLANNQSNQAFQLILPLAQKGFAEAQYIVATMFHDGEGVAQDLAQARFWYQKAIQNNNREIAKLAQEELQSLQ